VAKVGEGPAAKRYKAMLAKERASKAAKPAAKKAPAKPATLRDKIKARKKALDA
jgi:hypothetical protein